jgi:CRP-like cAMP-binding protein
MKPDNGARLDLILDSLAGIPLFDELSDDELKILGKHMHFLEAGEGEMIFEEGEKGNYVCFVADGELAVIKDAKSGERAIITKLNRGDSVGEMAVIDHFPRSATVIATADSNLVTLSSDDFKKLLDNHPQVGISILKGIARVLSINLRKTSSQLADYMLPIM